MNFETMFRTFTPFISNTDEMLRIIDTVFDWTNQVRQQEAQRWHQRHKDDMAERESLREEHRKEMHEVLVRVACQNNTVLNPLRVSKKIEAIKALRMHTGCGLREAKDAVLYQRVQEAAFRF